MYEEDLVVASRVCRRFYGGTNDLQLWKKLYIDTFEYTMPMYHPSPARFEQRETHRWKETNPWKESFRQLVTVLCCYIFYDKFQRHGIHVWPGREHIYKGHKGRSILHFERLDEALS